jgi:uncharacterized protein
MKILIAGGSGLIGLRLTHLLQSKGYEVAHLTRTLNPKSPCQQYLWNVENQTIDDKAILEADYIINLAGAGIADARWTASRKALIISSRAQSAKLILDTVLRLQKTPKAYISAAAIGFYGDAAQTLVDEQSNAGQGFLSESCMAWETAAHSLEQTSTRVVLLRIGIVLSTLGGALQQTINPLRLGVASYFGRGAQYYSWIHIDDVCGMFINAIENEAITGVYNAVAPNPVSNKIFTKVLKKCYGGFSLLMPVPNFVLKVLLGEMSAVVLTSTNVSAAKILKTGFKFQFPDLSLALNDVLNRKI